VPDRLHRIELTASFLERLDSIEAFLAGVDAAFTFDKLVAEIIGTVIPNLRRFPKIGRRYLERPPVSFEALAQFAALPSGAADGLRDYLHGDYLILYSVLEGQAVVHVLSIRHHRQLSFDFARMLPGN
jgi:plasmid stabilization system protein ParE